MLMLKKIMDRSNTLSETGINVFLVLLTNMAKSIDFKNVSDYTTSIQRYFTSHKNTARASFFVAAVSRQLKITSLK